MGKQEVVQKLPEEVEVWCCPSKQDKRVTLYLDGGRQSNGELGWVYKRDSNDDEYTNVDSLEGMWDWLLGGNNNISQPTYKLSAKSNPPSQPKEGK